ncbi:30S ribosomal protein S5 [Candidatus Beckwithbacteria bacterium]|nr:30S ribosomal protein S5 [Candidatus Beckwithbacteria bacterium]
MQKAKFEQKPEREFEEKVIEIRRISKKTKGGNKISFSALVVIGNNKGRAGVGLDKAADVVSAIKKAIRKAKTNLVDLQIINGTIAHEVLYKRGAAYIMLKPAPEGTGVIAGGSVRAVVEAFGIRNIVSKRMGTSNKPSNVYATFEALKTLKKAEIKASQEAKPEAKKELKEEIKAEKKPNSAKKAQKLNNNKINKF